MSSPRPKSPRTPVLPKKEDKEESIWDKLGTIGRKKGIKKGAYSVSLRIFEAFVWFVWDETRITSSVT